MRIGTRLSRAGKWLARVIAPFMWVPAAQEPTIVAETAWVECVVNLRVHRSFLHREEIPFQVRYCICHVKTLVDIYLPRVKRVVEPDEYGAFVLALAQMITHKVVDHEPVLMVLAVVAEERFRVLYDRSATFLHREIIEPLACVVKARAGERVNHHVVIVDEKLFCFLDVLPLPRERVIIRV